MLSKQFQVQQVLTFKSEKCVVKLVDPENKTICIIILHIQQKQTENLKCEYKYNLHEQHSTKCGTSYYVHYNVRKQTSE